MRTISIEDAQLTASRTCVPSATHESPGLCLRHLSLQTRQTRPPHPAVVPRSRRRPAQHHELLSFVLNKFGFARCEAQPQSRSIAADNNCHTYCTGRTFLIPNDVTFVDALHAWYRYVPTSRAKRENENTSISHSCLVRGPATVLGLRFELSGLPPPD
jgi:hypothetical protein